MIRWASSSHKCARSLSFDAALSVFGVKIRPIADAVERVVNLYLKTRQPGERFLDTYRRVGMAPFKDAAYEKEAA
mgnify:CR=1 FL=1